LATGLIFCGADKTSASMPSRASPSWWISVANARPSVSGISGSISVASKCVPARRGRASVAAPTAGQARSNRRVTSLS